MIELVVLGSYEDSGVKKLGKRKEKFLMCHPYLWLILFAKKYYRAPQKRLGDKKLPNEAKRGISQIREHMISKMHINKYLFLK